MIGAVATIAVAIITAGPRINAAPALADKPASTAPVGSVETPNSIEKNRRIGWGLVTFLYFAGVFLIAVAFVGYNNPSFYMPAAHAVLAITGPIYTMDVVDLIFNGFCALGAFFILAAFLATMRLYRQISN
jgi:hypothetical protein